MPNDRKDPAAQPETHAMDDELTSYRDYSPWPTWAAAVLWGSLLLSCLPLVLGVGDAGQTFRVAMVAALLGFGVVIRVLLGGVTVLVQETRVVVHLGTHPIIKKTIPYAEIDAIDSVRYSPLREFGGWGIRGGGRRQAWTARGDLAVVLTLTNGKQLYVGSDDPDGLERSLRDAMQAAGVAVS